MLSRTNTKDTKATKAGLMSIPGLSLAGGRADRGLARGTTQNRPTSVSVLSLIHTSFVTFVSFVFVRRSVVPQ